MRAFLLVRLSIYLIMTACIESEKEFKDVGAQKLHDYTLIDWFILVIGIGAVALPNVLSFFDTSFSTYLAKKNGDTGTWKKELPK